MSAFFIRRPIVAIVIAIVMTIVGAIAITSLPIAQFPDIVPPEIQVQATYVGADAETVEQSVATPIEQQMSGVDNMNYMYSTNANNGSTTLRINFDVGTDPNTDQILAQIRQAQANSQLPTDVVTYGVKTVKSTSAPLLVLSLYSPNGAYDATFLANYANINIVDQLTRVRGISQVTVYGAGQYAMRCWVRPDQLAKLNITVPEIVAAIQRQNTVNPSGQVGGEPVPAGQEFTYTVRAQGRLINEDEFRQIVIRAKPDGSLVRLSDVARIELGAQFYNVNGRFGGQPAAVLVLNQLPGSNALDAADGVKKLMVELKSRFPAGLDYAVSLDTTLAVTEGMKEILKTLYEALILVIIVVFLFLQNWRATLIPLLAVPVSLVSTFVIFPALGFSINTLSLFGLVLAIGLVVDDAIVVVEAVEHHIEQGLSPVEATKKAMEEVTSPVIGIAIVLSAVFVPTAFIPGITGRLYQQFAVTIAVSVIISAFNALTLSPALSAMILRPRKPGRGPLAMFFNWFNRVFKRGTETYVAGSHHLIRRWVFAIVLLLGFGAAAGYFGGRLPTGFLPEEDQGYLYVGVSLPPASSLQRTSATCRRVEEILKNTPGVAYYTTIVGFDLLSSVQATYNGFFFVSLKPWSERKSEQEQYRSIQNHINRELAALPEGIAFSFSPPAIPGIGTAGGVSLMLEDRAGRDVAFLANNLNLFITEARKRPEIASALSLWRPSVPQVFVDVDRDKVLTHGVDLGNVYRTIQCFMGGIFVNYFNRFGRQWQVYVQAEGEYRAEAQNVGQFYVRNAEETPVPLASLIKISTRFGPEFTTRYNLYRSAQINATAAPGYSSAQAMAALEDVFAKTMPSEMGYDYFGMSFQEKRSQQGVSPAVIFGFSGLFVFLILAALYESWKLPFSVLLGTPIAVFGAFAALAARSLENNVYAQIGLVMLIGLAAKNAILIVEFAKLEQERGRPLLDAALEGARLRLRPILMTSFAFILGCVPLWFAEGSGAASRQIMGSAVIGGMLAASGIAIFLTPVLFYMIERIGRRKDVPPAAPGGAA